MITKNKNMNFCLLKNKLKQKKKEKNRKNNFLLSRNRY